MNENPKVFISYAHDDEKFADKILEFANRLRSEGIDANIDQYEESPPEGWPRWMENQIGQSDFVLIIFSELYFKKCYDRDNKLGKGISWEVAITYQHIYDSFSNNTKFIPVVFESGDEQFVLTPIKGATIYNINDEKEYNVLYWRLQGIKKTEKPALGELKSLPEKQRNTIFKQSSNSNDDPEIAFIELSYEEMDSPASNVTITLPSDMLLTDSVLIDTFYNVYLPLAQDNSNKDYIDCSTIHINRVLKTIFELVGYFSKLGCNLNDIETYVLYCATILHHSFITIEETDSDIYVDLKRHILLVKRHHKCDCKRLGVKCECFANIPLEVSWDGQIIRLRFLTAILCICNALDCTSKRLNVNETTTVAKISNDIAFRWYSYYYIKFVNIDKNQITFHFRKPQLTGADTEKYYNYIFNDIISNIESIVRKTSDILRENNILINGIINNPITITNGVKMLPLNVTKYISEKLKKPIDKTLKREKAKAKKEKMFVNILHLSDMFFGIETHCVDSNEKIDANKSLRKTLNIKLKNERDAHLNTLPEELENWLIDNNYQIDFIVISGNIATSAQSDEYNLFIKWIMEQLLPELNNHTGSSLSKRRVVLCPGETDFSMESRFSTYSKMCSDLGIVPLTLIASDEKNLNPQESYSCGYRVFHNVAKDPITFIVFDSVSNRKGGKVYLDDENIILKMHNTIKKEKLHRGIVFSVFYNIINDITDISDATSEGKKRKEVLEKITSAFIIGYNTDNDFLEIQREVPTFNGGKMPDGRNDAISRFDIIRFDTDVYKYWGIVGKYINYDWIIEFDEKTPEDKGKEFKYAYGKNKSGVVADSKEAAIVAVKINKAVIENENEHETLFEIADKENSYSLMEKKKSLPDEKELLPLIPKK